MNPDLQLTSTAHKANPKSLENFKTRKSKQRTRHGVANETRQTYTPQSLAAAFLKFHLVNCALNKKPPGFSTREDSCAKPRCKSQRSKTRKCAAQGCAVLSGMFSDISYAPFKLPSSLTRYLACHLAVDLTFYLAYFLTCFVLCSPVAQRRTKPLETFNHDKFYMYVYIYIYIYIYIHFSRLHMLLNRTARTSHSFSYCLACKSSSPAILWFALVCHWVTRA